MSGGKGGGGQVVGYRYYAGIHMVLCAGPVDSISEIVVGERTAWTGNADSSQQITISAPELFGGDASEGGIVGAVDVMMGEATQAKNTYLTGLLGNVIPAFRGVCSLVLRRPQLSAMNPYIKPWKARATRIHTAPDGGTQWYDSKAAIPWPNNGAPQTVDIDAVSNAAVDAAGGLTAGVKITANKDQILLVKPITDGTETYVALSVWGVPALGGDHTGSKWMFNYIRDADTSTDTAVNADDDVYDGYLAARTAYLTAHPNALALTGSESYTFYIQDTPIDDNSGGISLQVSIVNGWDMNPAHIIRECLVNTVWGKGYSTDDVDDDAFTAAADTLYTENFGLSLLWKDGSQTIDQFIQLILQHIDGSLYADQTTGKFVLSLARDDYDLDDLITLDDSNIISVESFTRPDPNELINQVTVTYHDGVTDTDTPVTVQDIAALDAAGGEVRETKTAYDGISNAALATRVAMRDLAAISRPLAKATITTNRAGATLNIGSVFKFSNTELGISNLVMRVASIGYGTLTAGAMRVECVEDVFALPSSVYLSPQPTSWSDPRKKPTDLAHKLIGEIPYWTIIKQLTGESTSAYGDIDDDAGFLSAAAVRPSGDALNAGVWSRQGTADYAQAGSIPFCPSGTITDALDLDDTAITLENGEDLDTVALNTYAQIDDELVAVKTLDSATGALTVDRGVLDTVPAAHDAGARIYFLERFQFIGQTQYIDEAVDVKLTPKTGLGTLDIDDATASDYTFANRQVRPYPPGNVTLNGDAYPATITGDLTVAWSHRDRLLQTVSLEPQSEGDIGPETGTTYTLKLYDENGDLVRTEDALTGKSYEWDTESADSQIPSGAPDSDEHWNQVVLLLPFGGADGGTSFSDESTSAHAMTTVGGAQIDTAAARFGGASLLLDGSGDYISAAASSDFDPGDSDFSIEMFVRRQTSGRIQILATNRYLTGAPNHGWQLLINADNALQFIGWANNVIMINIIGSTALDTDSFAYVAAIKSGATWSIFVDGSIEATDDESGTIDAGSTFYLGHGIALTGRDFDGWVDSVRISKGIARDATKIPIAAFPTSAANRPNGKIRLTLKSVRDSYDSWQSHDITVKRQGYGYNYGESYGDN